MKARSKEYAGLNPGSVTSLLCGSGQDVYTLWPQFPQRCEWNHNGTYPTGMLGALKKNCKACGKDCIRIC